MQWTWARSWAWKCSGEVTVRARTSGQQQGEVKAKPYGSDGCACCDPWSRLSLIPYHTPRAYYVLARQAFLFLRPTKALPTSRLLAFRSSLPDSLFCVQVSVWEPLLFILMWARMHPPQEPFPDHCSQTGLHLSHRYSHSSYLYNSSILEVFSFVSWVSVSSSVQCKL